MGSRIAALTIAKDGRRRGDLWGELERTLCGSGDATVVSDTEKGGLTVDRTTDPYAACGCLASSDFR
jgi:hypothetical protein